MDLFLYVPVLLGPLELRESRDHERDVSQAIANTCSEDALGFLPKSKPREKENELDAAR